MKHFHLVAGALVLAACTHDRQDATDRTAQEAPLPSQEEVKAIHADAAKAAQGVHTSNADAKLDELERALNEDGDR